ncbi:hypothetical protein FRACA_1580016 [Frankia canadensis]|uniref:Uncharacterized protein n=1 Tax=Frankia canadensis TaxID=1836972 RepID=A0A2I2KMF1_9ACTN|nr:hypothetical protein FRACA_1580016 [Frankia canadensis]SOU54126.1 hypothetical protein FRACA_1580016 [Frankia canadensis]
MENEPTTATEWFATAWRAHLTASFGLLFSLQTLISICLPLIPPLAFTAAAAAFTAETPYGNVGGVETVGMMTVNTTPSFGFAAVPPEPLLPHPVIAATAAQTATPPTVARRNRRIQNPSVCDLPLRAPHATQVRTHSSSFSRSSWTIFSRSVPRDGRRAGVAALPAGPPGAYPSLRGACRSSGRRR